MKNLKKPARLSRKAPSNQTGGTAWGKKLAAEFSRMAQSADMKKLILLNFPYIIAFYMVEKAAWLYRHCNGDTVVDRLMVLFMNFGLAYKSVLPSFHPFDMMVGLVGAAALKAVIYFKGKNAKKYRQGRGIRFCPVECIILSVNDTYMDAQEVMHMTDYSKITALYSRLSVGDEDRDGGESNSIQNHDVIYKGWITPPKITS